MEAADDGPGPIPGHATATRMASSMQRGGMLLRRLLPPRLQLLMLMALLLRLWVPLRLLLLQLQLLLLLLLQLLLVLLLLLNALLQLL